MCCYSNCPYEVWGGDNWGDCANPKMMGTAKSHCRDDEQGEAIDPDDDDIDPGYDGILGKG